MKRLGVLLFFGSCAFLGSALMTVVLHHADHRAFAQVASPPTLPAALPTSNTDILQIGERFEAVARGTSPAVVAIEAIKPPAAGTTVRARPVEESGSGVIIRWPGMTQYLVLTNNHVVASAPADKITVSLGDGRVFKPGHVWADPESDVAILRLDGVTNLPAATLGDSDQVRVGQWVLAIGSPFGLNQTVTHGIISARERGEVSLGSTIRIKNFLQTDAAINPGSSGGPLVNLNGEVIGINTAIASQNGSNSGVAFSIPINMVKRVAAQLLEKGNVSRGYLGIQLAQTFDAANALKLGLDRVQGALVDSVYPETPAAAAGLKANDVIMQIDGIVIRNENHLINTISTLSPGKRIRLQVWRDRKLTALDAFVGDWNEAQKRFRAE